MTLEDVMRREVLAVLRQRNEGSWRHMSDEMRDSLVDYYMDRIAERLVRDLMETINA